jgi:hypothetical protein
VLLAQARAGQSCKLAALALLCLLTAAPSWSLQHDMHAHDASGMSSNENTSGVAEDPAALAERLAWKHESEMVHHLAGLAVLLAGLFILAEEPLRKRWVNARYAWPLCFLAAGVFLLVFSDTEIWPFGTQTPWYAITHNPEVLQHKAFALILLAIGLIEWQRAGGRFNGGWSKWLFPVVGMAGAILLLFHVHGEDMQAPHAMETMEHIQRQHRWFASVGFGIAFTNGLAVTKSKWSQIFRAAWPALLIVLGVLLMLYSE